MTVAVIEARLKELERRHAPDARLAVWDVVVEEGAGSPRLSGAVSDPEALRTIAELAEETGSRNDVELLPSSGLGGDIHGIAHRSVLHLRAEPRHGSELVSQMILGEEALVLRARGEWLQVQTGDRYVAWAHHRSLVRRSPQDPDRFRSRLFARRAPDARWVVTARGARAFEEPAPYSAPVADLVQGAIVEVSDTRGRFARVMLPDGLAGWVGRGELAPAELLSERFSPGGRAILDHAAQFLGLPYLWGGTTEKGFDCSGFVQRLFGLHGTWLPRDSDQQAGTGTAVDPGPDWSGVADGDLAFFAEREGGRATHVGILGRRGRMLHASTWRHGVGWDALAPSAEGHDEHGARLASMLSGVRRLPLADSDP